jgi:hypothetical protein
MRHDAIHSGDILQGVSHYYRTGAASNYTQVTHCTGLMTRVVPYHPAGSNHEDIHLRMTIQMLPGRVFWSGERQGPRYPVTTTTTITWS